ncbi:MAG: hypothetical protein E7640_02420 [Ruminococcaceae bacterium]|nr:hypothetical protein [Oscillospiraceae bacterium]
MRKCIIFAVAAVLLAGALAFNAGATNAVTTTEQNAVTTSEPTGEIQPREEISSALSPAVDIIAAGSPMAKAGRTGRTIAFSRDDFARALNLRNVNSITVVSVPDPAQGVLLLGNTAVTKGQKISGDSIGHLVFDPTGEGASQSSFEFSVNDSAYSVVCSLYILERSNANPTVGMAAETMLSVRGYESTAVFGKLGAYDPEGDALTFEIVKAPEHGLVIMNDREAGNYTYLPEHGFTGRDSFTYVVHDKYGNYSSSAEVKVTISEPATSVIYTDMVGNEACCASIAMTENGIMNGTQVGNLCYFYPDSTVSRVEFLVMAMNAAGIKNLPVGGDTGFADEKEIASSALPYVTAAKQLGYIEGSTNKDGELCFLPNETITRAEAAHMVNKIMNGSSYVKENIAAPVFSDASEIPEWAQGSVTVLSKLGVITDDGGKICPTDAVTRGQTAVMLNLMMQVMGK